MSYLTDKSYGVLDTPFHYKAIADIGQLVGNTLGLVTTVSGIILVIYFAYGGFRYVTAAGNDKSTAEAQKIMTNAAIGMIIVVLAYLIAYLIGRFLGVNVLSPTIYGPGY